MMTLKVLRSSERVFIFYACDYDRTIRGPADIVAWRK